MSLQLLVSKNGRLLHQGEPNCRNHMLGLSDFLRKDQR